MQNYLELVDVAGLDSDNCTEDLDEVVIPIIQNCNSSHLTVLHFTACPSQVKLYESVLHQDYPYQKGRIVDVETSKEPTNEQFYFIGNSQSGWTMLITQERKRIVKSLGNSLDNLRF